MTSSRDGTARIWSTDGIGEPIVLRHPGPVHSSAFSPDGAWVATAAGDGRMRLWDLRDPSTPVDVQEHEGAVSSVSFSPDGTRIALVGTVDSASPMSGVEGSPGVACGSSGRTDRPPRARGSDRCRRLQSRRLPTAPASWDGTVRLWRVALPDLLDYVRSNLHACLTPVQRIGYLAETDGTARESAAACEARLAEGRG